MSTAAQVKPLVIDPPREYAGARIFSLDRYRVEVKGETDAFTLEERMSYLRLYGDHCMSFSTLQANMHYFDVPGVGFIAYTKKWGTRYALADPVCDKKDRERLLRSFLNETRNVVFVQISQGVAELINEKFGFCSSQFGLETTVDLEKWDLKGKKKQVLRTSINQASKAGVVIEENYDQDGCKKLTQEWLKTRKVKNREVIFLIRPMSMEREGTRKFNAYLDGELIGFVFFDPVYSGNKVIGYVPNISRFSNKFKQGIFYPLMIHAMDVFKKEGVKYLYLGLCPMVVGDEDQPYESGFVKFMVRLLYKYANFIYSFKGLYFTKSRFEGEDHKTFCSHRSKMPVKEFLTFFSLTNII